MRFGTVSPMISNWSLGRVGNTWSYHAHSTVSPDKRWEIRNHEVNTTTLARWPLRSFASQVYSVAFIPSARAMYVAS